MRNDLFFQKYSCIISINWKMVSIKLLLNSKTTVALSTLSLGIFLQFNSFSTENYIIDCIKNI